jgi:hypothetical protein
LSSPIEELVGRLHPGARVVSVEQLGADGGTSDGATAKGGGYGVPLRVRLREGGGGERSIVLRTASANDFGHDRRSDRAQQILLSYDTFGDIPRHVAALEVGAVGADGRLIPLRDAHELYLVTDWAPGRLYADDLRRLAREGEVTPLAGERCEALAGYLAGLHAHRGGRPAAYTRSVRDLVGSGEGIFGIVDAYPRDTPGASEERLQAIEQRALAWRWRLRPLSARLARTHGDFHPFNVVFGAGRDFTLLDASRGCLGDPADDVACMAVNYVFFALEHRAAWRHGLAPLWRRFWAAYLDATHDDGLLGVAAPYLAWRCLVLGCPAFYPSLAPASRDALLRLAERALDAPRFEPRDVEELFH